MLGSQRYNVYLTGKCKDDGSNDSDFLVAGFDPLQNVSECQKCFKIIRGEEFGHCVNIGVYHSFVSSTHTQVSVHGTEISIQPEFHVGP